jgi:hypothetical protein
VPKREVKEEYQTTAPLRRRVNGGGISIRCAALLIPKPEVKEEQDEMIALHHHQRLVASRDSTRRSCRDPTRRSCLQRGAHDFNAGFMSSLKDHTAWEGNIEDVISLSIHYMGRPLIDLTCDDDKAGPSDALKDEPTDPRGKPSTDEDYNFLNIMIAPAAAGTISLF